MAFPGNTHNI